MILLEHQNLHVSSHYPGDNDMLELEGNQIARHIFEDRLFVIVGNFHNL